METDTKQEALSFLKDHSIGVLATIGPDGSPRARTVYYATDETFAVYFCTLSHTRKTEDIAHSGKGAFVVSEEDAPRTLQIEGTITDVSDEAVITDTVRHLLDTLMKRGPQFAPIAHLDPGKAELYKLTPTWVRFGDFTDGIGTDVSLVEIPL